MVYVLLANVEAIMKIKYLRVLFNIGVIFIGLFVIGAIAAGSHGRAGSAIYLVMGVFIFSGPILDMLWNRNKESKILTTLTIGHKILITVGMLSIPFVVMASNLNNFPIVFFVLFVGFGVCGIIIIRSQIREIIRTDNV